ncbi:MAG: DEAD/DEAH box helicase family protein [Synergistaceae bacterium]|nr:DEAD/DEAH box helicase family protein [Synergistaceae bacterium]
MYALKDVALHPWQTDCLRRWSDNGCRGIAGVATGAGKTMLALAAVCWLSERWPDVPLKVKIVVPRVFLADQWRDDILRFLGVSRKEVGLCYGRLKEAPDKPFMVYVLDTARRCAARHILRDVEAGGSVLLICDECHHFGSRENAHVFDFTPRIPPERYFALGLSATPRGENFEEVVVPAIGKEIYRYGLSDASRDLLTSDYAVFNIAVDFSPDEWEKYYALSKNIKKLKAALKRLHPSFCDSAGRVSLRELRRLSKRDDKAGEIARSLWKLYLRRKETVHTARARLGCGMEVARRLMPDHRIILFSERIKMADELYDALHREYPGRVCRYHSDMDQFAKRRALESYRQGEKTAIVCCRALDEGLNVPETDAGIIISASASERQRVQRIGRVVRRGEGIRPKQIYYLHIPGTTDPSAILPSKSGIVARDLYYDAASGRFEHPGYDELAAKALSRLEASEATASQLENAENQLERGAVRGDFLMSEKSCMRHLLDARPEEKDYWIAMLLLARENAR